MYIYQLNEVVRVKRDYANALTNSTGTIKVSLSGGDEGKGFRRRVREEHGDYMSRRVFKLSRSMASRTETTR